MRRTDGWVEDERTKRGGGGDMRKQSIEKESAYKMDT